ncbi:hypothetical protein [Allosalinactinospora lopnorensis]|uniref:hypothetical protein n=1 Tax=Allosalinactinospora lopnorensis TaxID=1352348 RepID=UPI000623EF5E|nr:hypothetical protein [Allosalinactinospora lopnorensis]
MIPNRLIQWLMGLTVLVIAANLAVKAYHAYIAEVAHIVPLVDTGAERNIPTAWNAALLLGVAVVAALVAREQARGPGPRAALPWSVCALAALAMTIDESLELHERLGPWMHDHLETLALDVPTYAWLVPGSIIAAGGAVSLMLWTRGLPADVRSPLRFAVLLYVFGAVVLEGVSGLVKYADAGTELYVLLNASEEGAEMAAAIVAIAGAGRMLHRDGSEGAGLRPDGSAAAERAHVAP